MEKHKIYLQLFADEDGSGTDGDGDGIDVQGDDPVSFDDFLREEGNQAEFDRRIQKAISKAVTKEKEKWEAITDDKLSEADRLAKMSKEEKKDYEIKKLKAKVTEMEREQIRADMGKTARKLLKEEGISIPDELLAHLIGHGAEETKSSVETFATLFKDAVQEAVKDKVKGKSPESTSGSGTMTKEQIMAIGDPEVRQQKMLENRKLFGF